MSRLEELIQELCPNGVAYKALSEIFDTRNGYTPSKNNTEYWENGTIPWFRMEDIRENGRILSEAMQYVSESAVKGNPFPANSIIVATSATIGEHALITVPSLANQRFTYLMLKDEYRDAFDPKFLYYYCFKLDEYCKECLNQGNFASVDMKKFAKFQFPLVPIEVQREIVRILDKFTLLTAELTAELTARKKQYEYYRDKLLAFKDAVEIKTIGEITRVFSASRVHKAEWTSEGVPFYRTSDIISFFNGVDNSRGKAFISEELYYNLSAKSGRICKNDILVTGGGTIGIPYIVPNDDPVYIKDADLLCIQHSDQFDSRFLYHYFLSTPFRDYLKGITHDATIPHYTISQICETPVPLPTIDVQNRIVSVLDNFDAICSDLNIGLPAEIEARKKQYEFYRDALLTFVATGDTISHRQTDRQTDAEFCSLIRIFQYVFGFAPVRLGDVIYSLNTGLNPRQFFKLNTDDACHYYITIREIRGGKIIPTDKTDRINDEALRLCNNRSNLEINDVLFSGTGTIGETAVITEEPNNWNIKEGVYVMKPNSQYILPKFLRYLLTTKTIKQSVMKKVAGGTVKSIPMSELKKIVIPIPSINKQKLVVDILDRFDALCHDISTGLPTEIEARQKQYEYYRDKLLTFDEIQI